MFKERKLVFQKIKELLNPNAGERTEFLNNPSTSNTFNAARIEAARSETNTPVKNLIDSLKTNPKAALWTHPKESIKKLLSLGVDAVTNIPAIPVNIARWILELPKIPARALISLTDLLPEKTAGTASKWLRKLNEWAHGKLGA